MRWGEVEGDREVGGIKNERDEKQNSEKAVKAARVNRKIVGTSVCCQITQTLNHSSIIRSAVYIALHEHAVCILYL